MPLQRKNAERFGDYSNAHIADVEAIHASAGSRPLKNKKGRIEVRPGLGKNEAPKRRPSQVIGYF